MNKLAIISAFLGGVKNRYMVYQNNRDLEAKFDMASRVVGCDGLELCYPADFEDPVTLKALLTRYDFGVSAVNFRSRRTGKWWRGSFTAESADERQEAVDDLRHAMDFAADLGCKRITTCPLNDGADSPIIQ